MKKSVGDYGYTDDEWSFKDDSEKIEWEEYYESRNGKWRKKVDEKDEQLSSKFEYMQNIDIEMEGEI